MISRVMVIVLIVSVGVFSACASSGKAFTPREIPSGKAVIYFYRPGAFSLAARTIFMAFPGSGKSCAMKNAGYYPLVVEPGIIKVAAAGTDARPVYFTVTVREGEESYVRVVFDESGLGIVVPAKFQKVDPSRGRAEIKNCSLISTAH